MTTGGGKSGLWLPDGRSQGPLGPVASAQPGPMLQAQNLTASTVGTR